MLVNRLMLAALFLLLTAVTVVESGKNKRRLRNGDKKASNAGQEEDCTCGHRHRRLRRQITDISFTECKGVEIDPSVTLTNFSVSSEPVIAPGDMSLGFDVNVYKKLPKHIQIDVNVYKYLFNLPLWIPCTTLSDGTILGSCAYKDLCGFLDSSCETLRLNGVPCGGCEKITPNLYSISKPFELNIPESKEVFDIIVQGEYMMRAEIVNTKTQELIGCTEAKWKISKIHKNTKMWELSMFSRSSRRRRHRKRNIMA